MSYNKTILSRIFRGGILNFRRGGTVSLASLVVVTMTLVVLASLIFFQAMLQYSLSEVRKRVDVTIYFTTNAPESRIIELQNTLKDLPEVGKVDYVSREDALFDFKERHINDYVTLQALSELDDNPFGAMLNVSAKDVSQYESIARFLEDDNPSFRSYAQIVDHINYNQNKVVIDKLNGIINTGRTIGTIITLVLAFVAFLITYNTIRLTIFISKEEISVMRLVGADNKYIRGPFLVEGMLYGVIGSVVAVILCFPITLWARGSVKDFMGIDIFMYFIKNSGQLFLMLLVAGIFVCALSSYVAIRKYLNK